MLNHCSDMEPDEKLDIPDDEPHVTVSQKFLYILYGILVCLLMLNFLKYFGYWPYKFHLEVITDPGVEVIYTSTNGILEIEHIVMENDRLNPKILTLK